MYSGKRILITGVTGSWGEEISRQLINEGSAGSIVGISRNEHKQVEFSSKKWASEVEYRVCDIRDKSALKLIMANVDVVFHLAALKHVPVCEFNTWQALSTNILGTNNIVEASIELGVEQMVDISTDKAVDPFNFYGMTKACGEKIVCNAAFNYDTECKFSCIRAGNVVGTNGSVFPLFKRQLDENNEITLTDPTMTRYLMSKAEAIGLVLKASAVADSGEILVTKMRSATVEDMGEAMLRLYGDKNSKIINIGHRPGEKIHEVLVSKNEQPYCYKLDDDFYSIVSSLASPSVSKKYIDKTGLEFEEYSSFNTERMTSEELDSRILELGL